MNVIQYASKTLESAQRNYATTEKDFLAVLFACDKFRPYIVDSKVVRTDHVALKYLIEKMSYPKDIKGIRSFIGHAGFYRSFIKDFFEISRPLTNLLQNDVPFVFDEDCVEAFEILKKALVSAPIVQPPVWNLPFQIMRDASDYVVGAVLGQRVDKKLNFIHYASKI